MASVKHGLFFFLLSKLLSINGNPNNPASLTQFSLPNGQINSWNNQQPQQPQQQIENGYNTYHSTNPQTHQPPYGMYPMNNQQPDNNGPQFMVPQVSQPYTRQNQQFYHQIPPVNRIISTIQPPMIQSDPMLQILPGAPQFPQPQLQHHTNQYQPTSMGMTGSSQNADTGNNQNIYPMQVFPSIHPQSLQHPQEQLPHDGQVKLQQIPNFPPSVGPQTPISTNQNQLTSMNMPDVDHNMNTSNDQNSNPVQVTPTIQPQFQHPQQQLPHDGQVKVQPVPSFPFKAETQEPMSTNQNQPTSMNMPDVKQNMITSNYQNSNPVQVTPTIHPQSFQHPQQQLPHDGQVKVQSVPLFPFKAVPQEPMLTNQNQPTSMNIPNVSQNMNTDNNQNSNLVSPIPQVSQPQVQNKLESHPQTLQQPQLNPTLHITQPLISSPLQKLTPEQSSPITSHLSPLKSSPNTSQPSNNGDSIPNDNSLENDMTDNSQTELQPPNALNNSPDEVSDSLENALMHHSNSFMEPELLNNMDEKKDSMENKEFYMPSISNGLAQYDESYYVDTEDENGGNEGKKVHVFAKPSDIHILTLPPLPSSKSPTNKIDTNPLNLSNPPSTPTSWSVPNNNRVQNVNMNPNENLPNALNKNNYQPDISSGGGQNQINSKVFPGSNVDQPSSAGSNEYTYEQVDLKNPPPDSTSWSLPKRDYSKDSIQNNGYSSTSVSPTNHGGSNPLMDILGLPFLSNQNSAQGFLNPLMSNINPLIQNMMSAISSSTQVPLYGTHAIFGVTQSNFPNIQMPQQINLTYAVIQSTIQSLQKFFNTVMNRLMGSRVKRNFDLFDPTSSFLPRAAESSQTYPLSDTLTKTNYQSDGPTQTMMNTNINTYNQQKIDPFATFLNMHNQPSTDISTNQFTNAFSARQPNINTIQQQQQQQQHMSCYSSGTNTNGYQSPQNENTKKQLLNYLRNQIKNAVDANLPESINRNSPEVDTYVQQLTSVVEMVFQNQINDVLQGKSPIMNMT